MIEFHFNIPPAGNTIAIGKKARTEARKEILGDFCKTMKYISNFFIVGNHCRHGIMGRRFPDGGLLRYRK